ncbi:DUF2497 domain-containing protein [Sphingomonas sanguinis]|uniref:DUF2497 domain-containing protein n=1 Tax=Sphingomonas sp. LC-1 TaxID=3110957 RepID=UPI0021BB5499|nr:DUF2497 domain-containing protein [Sphingomonas sp. LC-1]MCT8003079.1 DUF2497 domain-containing protein [Sphingomonas sp. LC-1]
MGEVSAEPSMEEILSSIKRIIAEEGEVPARQRRQPRPVPSPVDEDDSPEVLELSDPMPLRMKVEAAAARAAESALRPAVEAAMAPAPEPVAQAPAPVPAPAAPPVSRGEAPSVDESEEAIVSPRAAQASRGSLEALSRMMVKPEPSSDGTLEGLVRDMLRPMLRDWLDANLPEMVEAMVAKEIARITREGR